MARTVEWSVSASVASSEPTSLALPAITLPDLRAGVAFSLQLPMPTTTGTWAANTALPAGLTLNATAGTITGTPTNAGDVWPTLTFTEPN